MEHMYTHHRPVAYNFVVAFISESEIGDPFTYSYVGHIFVQLFIEGRILAFNITIEAIENVILMRKTCVFINIENDITSSAARSIVRCVN